MNDELFGKLTFDSDVNWWEGKVTLPSNLSLDLYIHLNCAKLL